MQVYTLFEPLLHKFYAASISVGMDGSLLVASTDERTWAWAGLFCLTATIGLVCGLTWRKTRIGKAASVCVVISLILPAFIIPSVRNEYIHASPQAITIESGRWYTSSRTILEMADIKRIRESDAVGILPANLIGDPDINWQVTRLDGKSEILELNDFFSAHRMVLAYYYKDRGVRFERLEDRAPDTTN